MTMTIRDLWILHKFLQEYFWYSQYNLERTLHSENSFFFFLILKKKLIRSELPSECFHMVCFSFRVQLVSPPLILTLSYWYFELDLEKLLKSLKSKIFLRFHSRLIASFIILTCWRQISNAIYRQIGAFSQYNSLFQQFWKKSKAFILYILQINLFLFCFVFNVSALM